MNAWVVILIALASIAILAADPSEVEGKLETIQSLITGHTTVEEAQPVYKRSAVAKLFGVHVRTVDYYGRTGKLDRVYGSGHRVLGFTRESVLRKLHGERERREAY